MTPFSRVLPIIPPAAFTLNQRTLPGETPTLRVLCWPQHSLRTEEHCRCLPFFPHGAQPAQPAAFTLNRRILPARASPASPSAHLSGRSIHFGPKNTAGGDAHPDPLAGGIPAVFTSDQRTLSGWNQAEPAHCSSRSIHFGPKNTVEAACRTARILSSGPQH